MTEMPTPPRRRWFRFSLVDLFIGLPLVAVVIGGLVGVLNGMDGPLAKAWMAIAIVLTLIWAIGDILNNLRYGRAFLLHTLARVMQVFLFALLWPILSICFAFWAANKWLIKSRNRADSAKD